MAQGEFALFPGLRYAGGGFVPQLPCPRLALLPEVLPTQSAASLPVPSWDEFLHSLSTLGVRVVFTPPVVTADSDESSHHSLDLPWTTDQAASSLRPVRDWWMQLGSRERNLRPHHLAP